MRRHPTRHHGYCGARLAAMRREGEMDNWSPGFAVMVTDTNIDYRSERGRLTVFPYGVWERYGDPYIF